MFARGAKLKRSPGKCEYSYSRLEVSYDGKPADMWAWAVMAVYVHRGSEKGAFPRGRTKGWDAARLTLVSRPTGFCLFSVPAFVSGPYGESWPFPGQSSGACPRQPWAGSPPRHSWILWGGAGAPPMHPPGGPPGIRRGALQRSPRASPRGRPGVLWGVP